MLNIDHFFIYKDLTNQTLKIKKFKEEFPGSLDAVRGSYKKFKNSTIVLINALEPLTLRRDDKPLRIGIKTSFDALYKRVQINFSNTKALVNEIKIYGSSDQSLLTILSFFGVQEGQIVELTTIENQLNSLMEGTNNDVIAANDPNIEWEE